MWKNLWHSMGIVQTQIFPVGRMLKTTCQKCPSVSGFQGQPTWPATTIVNTNQCRRVWDHSWGTAWSTVSDAHDLRTTLREHLRDSRGTCAQNICSKMKLKSHLGWDTSQASIKNDDWKPPPASSKVETCLSNFEEELRRRQSSYQNKTSLSSLIPRQW